MIVAAIIGLVIIRGNNADKGAESSRAKVEQVESVFVRPANNESVLSESRQAKSWDFKQKDLIKIDEYYDGKRTVTIWQDPEGNRFSTYSQVY